MGLLPIVVMTADGRNEMTMTFGTAPDSEAVVRSSDGPFAVKQMAVKDESATPVTAWSDLSAGFPQYQSSSIAPYIALNNEANHAYALSFQLVNQTGESQKLCSVTIDYFSVNKRGERQFCRRAICCELALKANGRDFVKAVNVVVPAAISQAQGFTFDLAGLFPEMQREIRGGETVCVVVTIAGYRPGAETVVGTVTEDTRWQTYSGIACVKICSEPVRVPAGAPPAATPEGLAAPRADNAVRPRSRVQQKNPPVETNSSDPPRKNVTLLLVLFSVGALVSVGALGVILFRRLGK